MKYAPADYAKAFLSLLEEYPSKHDTLIDGLVRVVKEAGDGAHIAKIYKEIERPLLKKQGRQKVLVVSARALGEEFISKIKAKFPKNTVFETEIKPSLIAGVRLIINNDQIIDGSLRKKLDLMFKDVVAFE